MGGGCPLGARGWPDVFNVSSLSFSCFACYVFAVCYVYLVSLWFVLVLSFPIIVGYFSSDVIYICLGI